MTNNAAEGTLSCVAVGRHNWTFAGSDEGGRRAAAIYTLVETCKLNGVAPRAWLADVLARLPDHPARQISELLPWNSKLKLTKPAASSGARPAIAAGETLMTRWTEVLANEIRQGIFPTGKPAAFVFRWHFIVLITSLGIGTIR
jgi:IS66 C-terminal element